MITIKHSGIITIETDEPLPPSPSQAGAWITTDCGGITVKSKGPLAVYKLPVSMKIDVGVSYVDAAGNPATVDGDVAWETSDKDIANVFRISGADSTKATVRAGKPGQAQITATADADLGEGVRSIITTMDIEVIPGEAVAGTITPIGEPEPA
jgi:hypothetical protein